MNRGGARAHGEGSRDVLPSSRPVQRERDDIVSEIFVATTMSPKCCHTPTLRDPDFLALRAYMHKSMIVHVSASPAVWKSITEEVHVNAPV